MTNVQHRKLHLGCGESLRSRLDVAEEKPIVLNINSKARREPAHKKKPGKRRKQPR